MLNALRNRRQHLVLWLALAAVLYRGLIPAGFMPASAEQIRQGAVLVLCSGGSLQSAAARGADGHVAHAYEQCSFAAAAVAGPLPSPARLILPRAATVSARQAAPQTLARGGTVLPPARGPPLYS